MNKSCLQTLDLKLRSLDKSYKPSYKNIHFENDNKNKTYMGAFLTVSVYGYVAFCAIFLAKKMIFLKTHI